MSSSGNEVDSEDLDVDESCNCSNENDESEPAENVRKRCRGDQEIIGVWNPCKNIESNDPVKIASNFVSQDDCEKALARMVIVDELPFGFAENEGFLNFCRIACPGFKVPSAIAIARACISMYKEEKTKLKSKLKGQRVCISIDTWTSLQNVNYICITAHYIDNEWMLQKKVLNFCVILNHKGETIGKMVEKCLLDWGIDGILTITCNDTSSNKLAIEWLKNSTKQWRNVILEHEFLHVECSGHLLNSVVRDGLEQFNDSIVRVREAVRYLRSYPSRWAKWEKCVKDENVDSHQNVCLDISNGWNSTYMMLEVAEKFEKAFKRLEDEDDGFRQYIETSNVHINYDEDGRITMNTRDSSADGLPQTLDWARAKVLLQFLEIYYGTMKKISGSCNVTSDILFHEIVTIKDTLKDICDSMDFDLCDMGSRMFNILDKYWNFEKINPMLLVAVVLDPRFKLEFLEFCMEGMYDESIIKLTKEKVRAMLQRIYDWHAGNSRSLTIGMAADDVMVCANARMDLATRWRRHKKYVLLESMSEVDRYLTSPIEGISEDKSTFEILGWWKINATRYPILSLVAKDVLAIPVTSVASEFAFSTGGCILDPFRTSLLPNTVEALVCTHNWLRLTAKPIDLLASMKEIKQYDALDAELLKVAVSEVGHKS